MEEKLLAKVRALLAKAQSTDYPAEAETYSAKAEALVAEYGITQAQLQAESAKTGRIRVTTMVIPMDNPYSAQKATLLGCIGNALGVKVISSQYANSSTVIRATVLGFPTDLERVELLYTSLLLQAARQLRHQYPPDPVGNVAAYRRRWFSGFAYAVQMRLAEIERHAAEQAQQHTPSGVPSTALVLRDRSALIEQAYTETYGNLKARATPTTSGPGFHRGLQAGARADLNQTRIAGQRAALR